MWHHDTMKPKTSLSFVIAMTALTASTVRTSAAQQQHDSHVLSCASETLARPHQGVSYHGIFTSSDYRFSLTIPRGITGWGAAPGAPFHGFAIFLHDTDNAAHASCIILRVEHEVRLPDDSPSNSELVSAGVPVTVGNRVALKRKVIGSNKGVPLENTSISLELPRESYRDFLEITMVTPLSDRHRAERLLRALISSLKFD